MTERDTKVNRLLVIGGSDAGISASLRAREVDPAWHVTIALADKFPNYSICGLPFYLSGETPDWHELAHRTRDEIESYGIDLLLDTVATSVDPIEHRVPIRNEKGETSTLSYDRLVIGTGALPARPPIRGLDKPGVFQLHSMADSFAVHEHLRSQNPKTAVIVGGGYIGLEMADALRRRDLAVVVLEFAPNVLQTVDLEFGRAVQAELERGGVDVRTSVPVEWIEHGDEGALVVGARDQQLRADMVLVVTGVRPHAALAKSCGIHTGERGAIHVTRRMATNHADIYAAGDCVETFHRLLNRPTYLPLGTTAHKQGRVAGENAVSGDAWFEGSLGTQVVKVFDLIVGRTGLRHDEALREGFDPLTVETKSWDHKAYYPGATEVRIRVTADRKSHRLLGAQILGSYGAEISKRLDVFATALFHGMRVAGVVDLDLSYTPPLASPWDPVQMSCMAWCRRAESVLSQ